MAHKAIKKLTDFGFVAVIALSNICRALQTQSENCIHLTLAPFFKKFRLKEKGMLCISTFRKG